MSEGKTIFGYHPSWSPGERCEDRRARREEIGVPRLPIALRSMTSVRSIARWESGEGLPRPLNEKMWESALQHFESRHLKKGR